MYTVLVCDDDVAILDSVEIYLKLEGYNVLRAENGRQAIEQVTNNEVHCVILDIMMPGMDGLHATLTLRKKHNIPIILLSAKSEDTDKITGLSFGADDYVTKPFNILELKARIRALLKRSAGRSDAVRTLLTVGDLSLDTQQRVAIRDGKTIDLTAKEYDLLELLMKNPRRVYSRESLMDLVWGYSYAGDYRTVDVHVRRLREKLERVPAEPAYIMTKWGVGYYFQGENQPTV